MKNQSTSKPAPSITCSICIANYNGVKFLADCIDSVMTQTGGKSLEIIIHDDASTDGSAKFIEKNYPLVKLIKSTENVGFCMSNNRMAELASGDYLLFLNNDAALFPDAIETLYKASQESNQRSILGLPQFNAHTGGFIDMGSRMDLFLNPIPCQKSGNKDVGMIIGACLWIPRDLWFEVGGFPEWFHTLAEDMHLCCAARLKGIKVRALSSSGFSHWVGRSIGGGKVQEKKLSTSLGRRIKSERNKTYVMFLCYPFPLFQLIFPLHIFLLLIEGFFLSLLKKDTSLFIRIYLGAVKRVFKNREFLLAERKKLQSQRQIPVVEFFRPFNTVPHKLRMLLQFGVPEIKS